MYRPTAFLLFLLFFWASCSNTHNELRSFYFPIDELREGLVYEYRNADDTALVDHYRFYKSLLNEDKRNVLVNTVYNPAFEQDLIVREQEVSNGLVCSEYRFLVRDSSGKTLSRLALIEEKTAFPYRLTADSAAPYRLRMQFSLPPDTSMNIRYRRDRSYQKRSEYEWQGQKLPALEFLTRESYNLVDTLQGGDWDVEYETREVFAQGIGLVYYEKKTLKGQMPPQRLVLRRRLSMDEFLKLSDKKLEH